MTGAAPVDALLAEAASRPFAGWDFSWLGARLLIEPAWDYTQLVLDAARDATDLLDMGTGGGEWLSGLPRRPSRTMATEAWPPNVPIAARRLRACGVPVVWDEGATDNVDQTGTDPRGRLPFRTGAFHLVVNRHEAFVAREVARVLTRAGRFITQQVDDGNLDDCFGLLGLDAPREPAGTWLAVAVDQLEAAGFRIDDARTGSETYRFADVGALAWYLQAVAPLHREWSDFEIQHHHDALDQIHARAEHGEPIVVRQKRLLVQARLA
ncbi:MAG: class I SAM-dependent methyltransferase [Acidimicrobiia bacterium]